MIESCCVGEIKRSQLGLVFEECKTMKLLGDLPVISLVGCILGYRPLKL